MNFDPDNIHAVLTKLLVNQESDTRDRADFRKLINGKLDGLTQRADIQNGKIAQAMRDIAELKNLEAKRGADLKDIIQGKRFVQKYLLNKYFLIGLGVFLFGLFKILANEESRGFLFRLLGL